MSQLRVFSRLYAAGGIAGILDQQRHALPAADAGCSNTVAQARFAQLPGRGHDQTQPGGCQWVSQPSDPPSS